MKWMRLNQYLAFLPDGVHSYPEHVVKAATFAACLSDKPVPVAPGVLPLPLEELMRNPPPVNVWVPEVQMVAVFKLIGDYHFEGKGGTPAFLDWLYEQNGLLLGGPLYRMLFWLVSPESIFVGVEKRWGALRRGTELGILERDANSCRVELRYAKHLLDEEALLAIGTALRAAADLAGAKESTVELLDTTPTRGEFRVRWENA